MNREKNKDKKRKKGYRSRAKLNLVLKVAAPRDDGYHPLISIFQEMSFSDELEVTLKEALKEGEEARLSLTCSDPNCPVNEDNTIVKADILLRAHCPDRFTQSVDARLRKNIPMGSGLGGGSSNAATYLMAMNEMAELGLSTGDLMALGTKIGADVPFFIEGGSALVEGIGEKITAIPRGDHGYFILIFTEASMSTKAVYEDYDEAGDFSDLVAVSGDLERAGCLAGERSQLGDNDLKAVVFAESQVLREAEASVLNVVEGPVYMSGSGATLFLAYSSEQTATDALARLQSELPQYRYELAKAITR